MPDKEIFVLKIVWKKSIASLHRLTQAVQHANLRRTAGDPTWVNTICAILKKEPTLRLTFYKLQRWLIVNCNHYYFVDYVYF